MQDRCGMALFKDVPSKIKYSFHVYVCAWHKLRPEEGDGSSGARLKEPHELLNIGAGNNLVSWKNSKKVSEAGSHLSSPQGRVILYMYINTNEIFYFNILDILLYTRTDTGF